MEGTLLLRPHLKLSYRSLPVDHTHKLSLPRERTRGPGEESVCRHDTLVLPRELQGTQTGVSLKVTVSD